MAESKHKPLSFHRVTIVPKQVSVFPPVWGIEEVPAPGQGRYVPFADVYAMHADYVKFIAEADQLREVVRQCKSEIADRKHQVIDLTNEVSDLKQKIERLKSMLNS